MLKIVGLSVVALAVGSGAAFVMNSVEAARAGKAVAATPETAAPVQPTLADNGQKQWPSPPPMTIDIEKKYVATLDTDKGKIVLDLFAKDAPKTVNNFVFLAKEKFYDGLMFHRVIADFMVQGGDPTGTGSGGPGYQFEDETLNNPHKHQVGTLSMANAGPGTNGSQFFITHVKTDWLDGKHTVFGQVKEGQDVVNKIAQGDKIKSVTISEEGGAAEAPATQPK